jgi:hypothetical protein
VTSGQGLNPEPGIRYVEDIYRKIIQVKTQLPRGTHKLSLLNLAYPPSTATAVARS